MSSTSTQATQDRSDTRQMVHDTAESLATGCRQGTEHFVTEPAKDLFGLAKDYAKEKPEVAAAWAFGLGFIIGWKVKPW